MTQPPPIQPRGTASKFDNYVARATGQEHVQKVLWCEDCKKETVHVATINKARMGCGFFAGNILASIATCGVWLPFFILWLGMGLLTNASAPHAAKYHCQVCGQKN